MTPPPQSNLRIDEVRSRGDREAFLKMPWPIYADDPLWVPPLLAERRDFLNQRKHPFFRHGSAAMFIARRDGEAVGRILVSDDPNYNAQHQSNVGCFGMFESIDDLSVAKALLDTAAGWLRSRGRDHMLGPIDYSTNYTCGLLIDGFDTPPRVLMNHNPVYYQRLLESYGLVKAKDLYSWWFHDEFRLEDRWLKLAERFAKRGRVVVRPVDLKDFKNEVERCKKVYNEAWSHNWGFVRMTDLEFEDFAKGLVDWMPPELVLLAEIDGEVAGLAMTLPDFNEALKPLDGRLFRWGLPLGLWEFKRNLKKVRTGRLIALGVLEPFRRRGATELLILNTLIYAKKYANIDRAELGWTLEDNTLINRAIEASGGHRYKTYRIYERGI